MVIKEYVDLSKKEKDLTGTARTNNKVFDENGFLLIKNIWDPSELYFPLPNQRGQLNYWGNSEDQYDYIGDEHQVYGSLARYWHPKYRNIHSGIRLRLEKLIGKKLYNTYYYDRFYFPGQELIKHLDRDACEISITVHASTNLNTPWPIWLKTPDVYEEGSNERIKNPGRNISLVTNPGDGVLYKGCERPHWRDPMPTEYTKTWYGKRVEKDGLYYHQIFFHYVIQDGQRAHCAWHMSR